jgi:glyoxylase-like metal-dependent hydrolase (beta-lactamase superfamily II)
MTALAARLEPVVPGVRAFPVRTPTLPPATHTNAWVLGARDLVVVDPASPYPEEQEALARALEGHRVRAIFLTHHHQDHVSGAVDLARRTGAPVLAHAQTGGLVPFAIDEAVDEGVALEVDDGSPWELVFTPGHAPGHLCLRRGDTIVAGDMVAGVGTIVLDPPEGELALYLLSLERLLRLEPARLLPAHGPVIEPAVPLLAHYVTHRHERTEQFRRALQALGAADPAAIARHVYVEIPPSYLGVAARQVLCHLQWLEGRGEVMKDGEQWRLR